MSRGMSVWDKPFTKRDAVYVAGWAAVVGVLAFTALTRLDDTRQLNRMGEHSNIRSLVIERCTR